MAGDQPMDGRRSGARGVGSCWRPPQDPFVSSAGRRATVEVRPSHAQHLQLRCPMEASAGLK